MELRTKRLRIIPLTIEQLALLCEGQDKLDAALGLAPGEACADAHTMNAYREMLQGCREHPKEYLWYTCWQIVLKDEKKSVGSIGFLGKPNKKNEAEIGYGIDENHRNAGYASEALQKMTEWAFSHGVYFLQARTDKDNIPSRRVLEKCGFRQITSEDEQLLYETEKQRSAWLSTCMCLGMSIGLCFGLTFENMVMGMCIGLAFGVSVGAAMDASDRKKHQRD